MEGTSSLVRLAAELSNAKTRESEAKGARIAAEDALVAATGFLKPEGQETYDATSDEGKCSVVVKQPINTTVDGDAWVKLRRTLRPKHPGRGAFVAKYSLDTKAARTLQKECPSAWADISAVVTRKPGKIAVEVKSLVVGHMDPPLGQLGATEVNMGGDA